MLPNAAAPGISCTGHKSKRGGSICNHQSPNGYAAGKLTSTCMALYFQQSLKVTATFQQKGGKSYPNFDITECLRITILCTHPFAPAAGDDVCEHATCGYAVHSVCAGAAGLGSAFAWQTSPKTSTFLDRSNMTRCI